MTKSKVWVASMMMVAIAAVAPGTARAGGAGNPPLQTVGGTMQVRAADGSVERAIGFATIEGQCVDTRMRDGTRSFEAKVCHRETTPDGRVMHVSWSLAEGKRIQSHDAWAVIAAGGTLEVGAAKGKGEALVVTLTK
jgi:hypothetical protein